MKTSLLVAFSVLALSSFAGCAAEPGDEVDSTEGETTEDEVVGAQKNFGYFVVTRRDTRKCAAPFCGGFFVKRVNEPKTTCADGTKADECYVSEISFPSMGLSDREEETVRAAVESGHGVIKAKTYKQRKQGRTVGVLKANEAWVGATGADALGNNFYRIADNGVRCITAPCPSTSAYTLNSNQSYDIVSYDISNTDLPAEQSEIDAATFAVGSADGILVSGGLAMPKCMENAPNCGPFVHASEFFLKVTAREGKSCGGMLGASCNEGQFCSYAPEAICGAADAPGTCAYKPEMCPMVYLPVCGCDGNTYGNACQAASAGMSVVSTGECAQPTE